MNVTGLLRAADTFMSTVTITIALLGVLYAWALGFHVELIVSFFLVGCIAPWIQRALLRL